MARVGSAAARVESVVGTGRRGFTDGHADIAKLNRPFGLCALPRVGRGVFAFTDMRNNAVRSVIPIDAVNAHQGQLEQDARPHHYQQRLSVQTVPCAGLLAPKGTSASSNGRLLFICDSGHHRIKLAALPGWSVLTDAQHLAESVDMCPFAGSGRKGWRDVLAADSNFNAPAGICERSDGSVAVSDTGSHCIRLIYVSTSGKLTVRTIAGGYAHRSSEPTHQRGQHDDRQHWIRIANRKAGHADGLESLFRCPTGIIEGSRGELIVADTMNNCIRVLTETRIGDHTAPWVARTLCGHTERGLVDGACQSARFYQPTGLCWGSGANRDTLFVSDTGNACLRQVDGAHLAVTATGEEHVAYSWVRTIEIGSVPGRHPIHKGFNSNQSPKPAPYGVVYTSGEEQLLDDDYHSDTSILAGQLVDCDGETNAITMLSAASIADTRGTQPAPSCSDWVAQIFNDSFQPSDITVPSGRRAAELPAQVHDQERDRDTYGSLLVGNQYEHEQASTCTCDYRRELGRALHAIHMLKAENAQLKRLIYSTFDAVESTSKRVFQHT